MTSFLSVHATTAEEQREYVDQAIRYLNKVRRNVDSQKFKESEPLNNAAYNHSQYLHKNENKIKGLSHQQKKGMKDFTGVYPWDRAAYYQYTNPYVLELYTDSSKSIFNNMIQLLDNPYNRAHLLNPNYTDIGMGKEGDKYVLLLGGEKNKERTEIVYPFNQQKNVPTDWQPEEGELNPYDRYKGVGPYGYPISFTVHSPLKVKKIELDDSETMVINKEKENGRIGIIRKTPSNDKELSRSVLLLPTEPLESNTEYQVIIKGTLTTADNEIQVIDKKWNFYTGSIWTRNDIDAQVQIKRKQYAELIYDKFYEDSYNNYYNKNTYVDVDPDTSYAKKIYTLKGRKIMNGYSETLFAPDDYITREQAFVIAIRLYEKKSHKKLSSQVLENPHIFDDMDSCSSWAIPYIQAGYEYGIIRGEEGNLLSPSKRITFFESETIMERVQEKLNGNDRDTAWY